MSTRAAGRKFGWALAFGFAAIALIAFLRHRVIVADILASISCVAFLAGLLVPTHLGPVERAWMGFGHALSRITTPLFLGIVYFGIVTPMGWIRRRIGSDPIRRDPNASTYWIDRPRMTADARRGSFEHLY